MIFGLIYGLFELVFTAIGEALLLDRVKNALRHEEPNGEDE